MKRNKTRSAAPKRKRDEVEDEGSEPDISNKKVKKGPASKKAPKMKTGDYTNRELIAIVDALSAKIGKEAEKIISQALENLPKNTGMVINYGSDHGAIPMTERDYEHIKQHFINNGEEGGRVGDCSINLGFFNEYCEFKGDISGEGEPTEFIKEVENYLQYEILDVLALIGQR